MLCHTHPNRRYEAKPSRDYSSEGWWYIREFPNEHFIPRVKGYDCDKDKYFQTEFAAREAAAVLNLQVEVEKRLKTLANEAVSHG